jgi:dTDP-4-dehydrorhamnose reductase
MKWAVVGSAGMFGKDLVSFLEIQGERVDGLHRGNLDLTEGPSELVMRFVGFDVIVNCVAYTKVDQAETEREEAFFANALVPSLLAEIADAVGAKLIHISTDYVFDGRSHTPYLTQSPKNPESVYGKTKSMGEDAVLAFDNSSVVRTSWLYGAKGKCFPKTIARKLLAGDLLQVVDDQIGSPTHTKDLAEFIFKLGQTKGTGGIWHGVSSGSTSWFGFSREIALTLDSLYPQTRVARTRLSSYSEQLSAIRSSQHLTPAKRPANSVLQPSILDNFEIPEWKYGWSKASQSVLLDF